MDWLTRYRIRSAFKNSLWILPSLAILAALVVAPMVRWIDYQLKWAATTHTPEGARALLTEIVPATLTFISLVLSTLLIVVQLASSQMSPRLISISLARREVKVCLSMFTFSFTYCAAVASRITLTEVPQLPMVIAVLSTLLSVVAGLYLIDFLAKELRPVRMLARTGELGRQVIDDVYPVRLTGASGEQPEAAMPDSPSDNPQIVEHDGRGGILQAIDVRGILAIAEHAQCVVEVIPQVGDFVPKGDVLFRVHGKPSTGLTDVSGLRRSLAFSHERTLEQDPAFAFRILVDIASKALSPAINDPTTAVLALDQIHYLLRGVGMRRLDMGLINDRQGRLRVLYRTPDWEDFVLLAVSEIRRYGAGSIQVARRLKAMLQNLCVVLPPVRAAAMEEQLKLLKQSVGRDFRDAADRREADTGDYQGVGSPRPPSADAVLAADAENAKPKEQDPAGP